VGAAIGGVSGHLWRGLSRSAVKELGELIDAGEAALLVVGATTLEAALDKVDLKAEKHVAKQLDVSTKDVDEAVTEPAGEVGSRSPGYRVLEPSSAKAERAQVRRQVLGEPQPTCCRGWGTQCAAYSSSGVGRGCWPSFMTASARELTPSLA